MVWGQMVHEVMQRCLISDRWDDDFVKKYVSDTVSHRYMDVLRLSEDIQSAKLKLGSYSSALSELGSRFIGPVPKVSALYMPSVCADP